MRPPSIWKTLGLSRTQDRTEIRRAYARKLKVTNPEDDPEGFKVLRAAYEQALDYADNRYVPYEFTADEAQDIPEATDEEVTPAPGPEAHVQPVVDPVVEVYFAAFNQLEKQLSARSEADDNALLASLALILSSPMLDNIEMRDSAEQRLAQLVTRTQPRSDALIPRLIERFNWNGRRIDRHQTYAVRQALQRETDLAFLRNARRSDDSNADAWRVLSRPPEPQTLLRRLWPKASRTDILAFLNRVRNAHPTLMKDLNEDSVRIWQERAQARDLFDQIRVWAFVTFPVGLVVMLCTWISIGLQPVLLAILATVPVVSVGGALAYEYGYYRARRSWQDDWHLQQNGWLAFGWGLLLILALCLAAAPPSPWLTVAVAALSIGAVWWAAITGEPDRSEQSWPWQIRLVVAELFLVAWWVCALWDVPPAEAIQMTPAVVASTLVAGFGRMSLFHSWLRLGSGVQRAVLCLLAAGITGAIAVLWQGYAVPEWKAPAFAFAAIMILLHRVPTLAVAHWTSGYRYVVAYGGLFIARSQGSDMMSLAFAGSVLLAWAGLLTGLALYDTWRQGRRKAG